MASPLAILRSVSGEEPRNTILWKWREAVSRALDNIERAYAISFPALRVGRGATAPSTIEAGPSLGYQMGVDYLLYAEEPLHPLRDASRPIICGLGWAPTASEAAKTVTWTLNIGFEEEGHSVAVADFSVSASEIAVPATAALYARTALLIPSASLAAVPGADELHIQITRGASEFGPTSAPAIHHLAVLQPITLE